VHLVLDEKNVIFNQEIQQRLAAVPIREGVLKPPAKERTS
jgi:hypothetical protein